MLNRRNGSGGQRQNLKFSNQTTWVVEFWNSLQIVFKSVLHGFHQHERLDYQDLIVGLKSSLIAVTPDMEEFTWTRG
ncbi:hypothetical protein Patl1_31677 [Pistacia atlantica]|uniref:Uncharacterized protein n=1 Tax=Pistacia atlantica TaxID=434234 RepID=A0ACC1APG3_9ROSI|nr:hypothetical protein Patl1_31677 [Pistacia atlantica]